MAEPLLSSASSSNYSTINKSASTESLVPRDTERLTTHGEIHNRSIENEVIPETAVLGRNLGWSSAYILVISRVIGSGIFATPGAIVRSVGSIGLSLVLWVAGALFAWFGLAITLEYGCMLPRSGGDKVYLEFTYRRPRYLATTLIAVQSVMLGFTASNCIVFAEYVLFARGKESTPFEMKLLAVGLLASICTIHSCFLKTGIWIQNFLGWIKIALIVLMVFTSLFTIFFAPHDQARMLPHQTPPRILSDGIWEGSVWNWGIVSTAFFKVWYSFAGLQNVNNVLNEVKNPVKTLKSAASMALLSACVLYLLINVAYFLVIPLDEIKDSGELIAGLFFERLFGARTGRVLLPLAVATSAAGNVMVVTFSHIRPLANQFDRLH
jgi:amino acid transporter